MSEVALKWVSRASRVTASTARADVMEEPPISSFLNAVEFSRPSNRQKSDRHEQEAMLSEVRVVPTASATT